MHLHLLYLHRLFLFDLFILLVPQFFLAVLAAVEGSEWHEGPFDDAEADIVLPDDGRVQTVEIQQQDEILIEAFEWIQHVASLVLLPIGFFLLLAALLLSELIGNDQTPGATLMHDKILVPLSPLYLQRPLPRVTANITELPGDLQDLEMVHEGKGHLRLLSGLADDQHRLPLIQVLKGLFLGHASKGTLGPDVLRH